MAREKMLFYFSTPDTKKVADPVIKNIKNIKP